MTNGLHSIRFEGSLKITNPEESALGEESTDREHRGTTPIIC
jgi:hypothetical protein